MIRNYDKHRIWAFRPEGYERVTSWKWSCCLCPQGGTQRVRTNQKMAPWSRAVRALEYHVKVYHRQESKHE